MAKKKRKGIPIEPIPISGIPAEYAPKGDGGKDFGRRMREAKTEMKQKRRKK